MNNNQLQRNYPDYLTVEIVERLAKVMQENPKDKALFETMFNTGIRSGELCSLVRNDVDFDKGLIRVTSKKGEKRFLPLASQVRSMLYDYIKTRIDSSQYLFVNNDGVPLKTVDICRLLTRYSSLIQLDYKVRPKMLRETLIRQALANGLSIIEIAKILGMDLGVVANHLLNQGK